jgi:hypothetical protein
LLNISEPGLLELDAASLRFSQRLICQVAARTQL